MTNRVLILRVSYWVGAVLDAVMLLPMLAPPVGGAMFGLKDFHPGDDYRYAMMLGASLMAGWTVLLIWADRKPVERKGVLLLTIVVVAGMLGSGVFAVVSGLVTLNNMAPTWVLQICLLILFSCGYVSAPHSALSTKS
jgi:hypothetical protein